MPRKDKAYMVFGTFTVTVKKVVYASGPQAANRKVRDHFIKNGLKPEERDWDKEPIIREEKDMPEKR